MILLSSRLIQYMTYTRSLQASPHSHMRPHFPGPDDMKSRFRRTDNWRKGLVSDFSPLFWSGSVEYCRRPLAERASAKAVLTPNDRSAQRPPPLCSIARTRPSSELLEGSKETLLDQQPPLELRRCSRSAWRTTCCQWQHLGDDNREHGRS